MTRKTPKPWCHYRAYKSWRAMLHRCTQPCDIGWRIYGGRGISVCDRWRVFESFLEDMGECPPGMFIDRIDNDGNYNLANCRWVTRKEQNRNRGYNKYFTIAGKRQCLKAWAEEFGMNYKMVWRRIKSGWSHMKALTHPKRLDSRNR